MSINSVTISGNLTRDPELRQTQGGTAVLSLCVAVNDRRRNQQTGEWEDHASFVDCVVFGNRAEGLSKVLAKGMRIAVTGRLNQRSWEDQDGRTRSKLEVVVGDLDFMARRAPGQGDDAGREIVPELPDHRDVGVPGYGSSGMYPEGYDRSRDEYRI